MLFVLGTDNLRYLFVIDISCMIVSSMIPDCNKYGLQIIVGIIVKLNISNNSYNNEKLTITTLEFPM